MSGKDDQIMKVLQCGFVPDSHGDQWCCIDGYMIKGRWITGEDLSQEGVLKETIFEVASNCDE